MGMIEFNGEYYHDDRMFVLNLSAKKLTALECPFEIGAKFSIEVNQKTKKIVLTAA